MARIEPTEIVAVACCFSMVCLDLQWCSVCNADVSFVQLAAGSRHNRFRLRVRGSIFDRWSFHADASKTCIGHVLESFIFPVSIACKRAADATKLLFGYHRYRSLGDVPGQVACTVVVVVASCTSRGHYVCGPIRGATELGTADSCSNNSSECAAPLTLTLLLLLSSFPWPINRCPVTAKIHCTEGQL